MSLCRPQLYLRRSKTAYIGRPSEVDSRRRSSSCCCKLILTRHRMKAEASRSRRAPASPAAVALSPEGACLAISRRIVILLRLADGSMMLGRPSMESSLLTAAHASGARLKVASTTAPSSTHPTLLDACAHDWRLVTANISNAIQRSRAVEHALYLRTASELNVRTCDV